MDCRASLQRALGGQRGWEKRGEAEGLKEQAEINTNAFQRCMCVCEEKRDRLKIFLRRQKVE